MSLSKWGSRVRDALSSPAPESKPLTPGEVISQAALLEEKRLAQEEVQQERDLRESTRKLIEDFTMRTLDILPPPFSKMGVSVIWNEASSWYAIEVLMAPPDEKLTYMIRSEDVDHAQRKSAMRDYLEGTMRDLVGKIRRHYEDATFPPRNNAISQHLSGQQIPKLVWENEISEWERLRRSQEFREKEKAQAEARQAAEAEREAIESIRRSAREGQ